MSTDGEPKNDASTPVVPAGIAAEMAAEGGTVTFSRFMDLALTHHADGYYSRTDRLLGYQGHFSTVPHLSPFFNRAVSRLVTELVDALLSKGESPADTVPGFDTPVQPAVAVIELGAGEGDLAKAVLGGWQETRPNLRGQVVYGIVEVGANLRARQRKVLSHLMAHGWQVCWAHNLVEAAAGASAVVVVGNEFVDALPVHLIDVRGDGPLEAWVHLGSDEREPVSEVWSALSAEAEAELRFVLGPVEGDALRSLSTDGIIELRPAAAALLGETARVAPRVCLLTIDYGEWFAGLSEPTGGSCGLAVAPLYRRTLRGYFRHQMTTDPYTRIGRQDLTADVDFRALDQHGHEFGFETMVYTNVACLVLANGGEDELAALRARAGNSLDADREATVLENLLAEKGLGGSFKVLLQVKE